MPVYGNGTIDRYPPLKELKGEKLLIFTEKTFEIIKREIRQFQALYKKVNRPKQKKTNHSQVQLEKNFVSNKVEERVNHPYKPSNIHHVYNSLQWRWRRVTEWFNQYSQQMDQQRGQQIIDDKTLKNLLEM